MKTNGPNRQFHARRYPNVAPIARVRVVMADRSIVTPLQALKSGTP